MSGHSKWSTIKRQKALKDNAKGKEFSKLSRGISIAVKTGGGSNPESNYKLRIAIEEARAANMPKDTIQRAILKASEASENIEELVYEAFGPSGVQVLIEAATDNRNRTAQELKNILEKAGGTMGGPGSVGFNFETIGVIRVEKAENVERELLSLIDFGVKDVEEYEEEIEVYVEAHDLFEIKNKLEAAKFKVLSAELVRHPKSTIEITDSATAKRLAKLIESLEDSEDVQKVYVNADFTGEALANF